MTKWEELKKRGSAHYKTGDIELIDLLRTIKPHPSLNVLEVKALADEMKYAWRQLQRGIQPGDLGKVGHYNDMMIIMAEEEGGDS